jgi:hypothetical protein
VDVSHHYFFLVFSLIYCPLPGSASSFTPRAFPVFLFILLFPSHHYAGYGSCSRGLLVKPRNQNHVPSP